MLGYGAWRAHTHASVWLSVHDHAGRTPRQRWADVKQGQLVLQGADGSLLAEAQLEGPHGLPRWTGPAGAAVDCPSTLPREAWQRCYETQSRWVARWAPRVAQAAVGVGACRIERVPVERRSSSDWWLWWVPLPHVGGTPAGYHTLSMHVDSARCAAVAVTDP